jgi:hypothetical protein
MLRNRMSVEVDPGGAISSQRVAAPSSTLTSSPHTNLAALEMLTSTLLVAEISLAA